MLNGSGRAYHGVARDSVCLIEAGEPITAARVIRYLSCHEDRLYHGGKRASVSIVAASTAARDRVPGGLWSCPGWVCGHLLGLRSLSGSWSLVMSWGFCGHLLGLWSSPGSWAAVMSWMGLWSSLGSVVISCVCGHFLALGLWSCLGSVVISWLVVCGHVLGGSVVIFWACGSFPGSWAVVMS